MNLEDLKAQHPAIYKAAVAEGAQRERHRVSSHIIMGQKSGDLKTAHAAIRSGADLTFEIQTQYMAAGMNRADVRAHQSDSDLAEAVVEGAQPPASGFRDDQGEAVLTRLTELVGDAEVGERDLE